MTPKRIDAAAVAGLLRPGLRVFVEGATAEPAPLLDALESAPDAASGVEFVMPAVPGVNRRDLANLHSEARALGFFVPPEVRSSFEQGRFRHLPMHYAEIWRYMAKLEPIDIALIQVAPPDATGQCSLGVNADFATAVLGRAKTIVAEVNARMPRCPGAPSMPWQSLAYVVESDRALPEWSAGALDPEARAIGRHAASLVRDGDCVQIGIGKPQAAVLAEIGDRRDLGFHSGMLTDAVLDLVERGALTGRKKTRDVGVMVTGFAVGSARLYDACPRLPIAFREAGYTHDFATIASIDNFVSINAALEVDLFGQVNSETLGGRQISGTGGFADYQRAAASSQGGRSLVCLPSSARGGSVSRIVPRLADGIVTGARGDADFVITEQGVAALRGKTLDERAEALVSVAAPAHRRTLIDAWRDIRKRF
jgi:4-hydroxybutyrate CoA-transferase